MQRSLLYTTFGSGKKVEIYKSVSVKLFAEYMAIGLKESASSLVRSSFERLSLRNVCNART
mgnify:CR=1 FL=1